MHSKTNKTFNISVVKSKEENTVKYPIKRFEPTLRTSLQIAIPTNLQRLKKHRSNIEKVCSQIFSKAFFYKKLMLFKQ